MTTKKQFRMSKKSSQILLIILFLIFSIQYYFFHYGDNPIKETFSYKNYRIIIVFCLLIIPMFINKTKLKVLYLVLLNLILFLMMR